MKKRKVEKRIGEMQSAVGELISHLRSSLNRTNEDIRSLQSRVTELERAMWWPKKNNKWPTK